MATRALLDTIEDIDEKNDALAEKWIDLLREKNLLSQCCIGSDAEGGVSIVWTQRFLFCTISEERIYISVFARNPSGPKPLKSFIYETNELEFACQYIARYLDTFPGELV